MKHERPSAVQSINYVKQIFFFINSLQSNRIFQIYLRRFNRYWYNYIDDLILEILQYPLLEILHRATDDQYLMWGLISVTQFNFAH